MYNCLISFRDEHKILYKFKFGFRKSHSTSHAIMSLVEKNNNALDSGNILIGVFLDFKKRLIQLIIQFFWINFFRYCNA